MITGSIENVYGHVMYCFEKDYVHIYNLYINHEYRNKGHAKYLLQRAIEEIRKTGYVGDIFIVADPKEKGIDKKRLKNFYKKMKLVVYDKYVR